MRDDTRRPPGPASEPQPPAPTVLPRERHPALRPRLGDIGEEQLRAFSSRPSEPEPLAEVAPRADDSGADALGNGPGRSTPHGRRKKAGAGSPRARLRQFSLRVLLPSLLAGGVVWALTTPRLAVHEVAVSGLGVTPDVLVQPVSQALIGQNWLRADLAAARARLEKLPTVKSAVVSRAWNHWPPRLVASIQERKPWLRLGGGGDWWIIDRAGVAFRRASRQDRALYAVTATAFKADSLHAGQAVPTEIWSSVRRLALALDESVGEGEPWALRRAYLDREGMASLRLREGGQHQILVRLGDGLWPQKMARARRSIAFLDAAGRRAASLNLVSFSMPTWTPLQPTPNDSSSASPDADAGADNTDAPPRRASNTSGAPDASPNPAREPSGAAPTASARASD